MIKIRKWSKRIHLVLIVSLVLMAAICIGCHIDANAKDKTLTENEKALNAYQEFLRGERQVYIENNMKEELHDLGFEIEIDSDSIFLEDILKQIDCTYMYIHDIPKIETISYAYLDCFNDGKQELAVRFRGLAPSIDDEKLIFIIVYEKGKLYLRHSFLTWSRNRIDLYYYGYVIVNGSDSAFSGSYEEYFIDGKGKKLPFYAVYSNWESIADTELCNQAFGKDEFYAGTNEYTINGKTYLNIHTEDTAIDEESWNKFCSLYEQKYEMLYTDDEIEALVQKRWDNLGVEDAWKEQKELEWQLLEDAKYKEYVKEIELLENRKTQQAQKKSVLSNKWVECKAEKFSFNDYFSPTDICFEVNLNWRYAIEYALTDYSSKSGNLEGAWKLNRIESYGDDICAVTVQCENPRREICLILNSDAVKIALPEYIEYIIAVDFRYDDEGSVAVNSSSYDSVLDWTSYSEQAKWWLMEQPYTINSSEDDLYIFDSDGIYAMNTYLKRQDAPIFKTWNLNANALCPIAHGRLAIFSYSCGKQNIVMILDTSNKKFAVIKGLR